MQRMSYDIAAKGFQEIDGVRVKVFAGVTREGKVMRQTSMPGASDLVEIGEIDMSKGMSHVQSEFEAITGLKPYATADEAPVTGELDESRVTKTSPKAGKKSGKGEKAVEPTEPATAATEQAESIAEPTAEEVPATDEAAPTEGAEDAEKAE